MCKLFICTFQSTSTKAHYCHSLSPPERRRDVIQFTSMSHHPSMAPSFHAVLPTTCPGVLDLYWAPSHHLPPPGAYQKGSSPKWMGAKFVWGLLSGVPSWMVQVKGSLQAKASSQFLKVGCLKSCFSLSCW